MSTINIVKYQGLEVLPYIPDLAKLRIKVFREYPYLYDGSLSYERKYLDQYIECQNSIIILALDGERVIGASTAIPLQFEHDLIKKPFIENHYDIAKMAYFAESVLLPEYRGQGIGRIFFEKRLEAIYQQKLYEYATFFAVDRPPNHPKKPPGYYDLDHLWESYDFKKHPEITTIFYWKEVGEMEETPKPMTFWLKKL